VCVCVCVYVCVCVCVCLYVCACLCVRKVQGSGLPALKNECRKHSCPVGGEKAELCNRLARKGYPSADEVFPHSAYCPFLLCEYGIFLVLQKGAL